MGYCNFLQGSETIGKTSLNIYIYILVFDKSFSANPPAEIYPSNFDVHYTAQKTQSYN